MYNHLKEHRGVYNFALGAIVVFATIALFNGLHGTTTDTGRIVYDTCMNSRYVARDNGQEDLCGQAQDLYKYEFLCDGIEASSSCWVESNDKLSKD
jgi:hypothetical protein